MSALTIPALVLFPGLGLVALAIWLLAQRSSVAALGVGLTGLFAVTTGATWLTTAAPLAEVSRVTQLEAEIEKLRADLERARLPAVPPPAPLIPPAPQSSPDTGPNLVAQLAAALNEPAAAQAAAERAQKDAQNAMGRIAELNATVGAVQDARQTAERRIAELEDELIRAQPPQPPPPRPVIDVASIRQRLTDADGPFAPTPLQRGPIPGLNGAWYVVRLLQDGQDWAFPDRQFVLTDASALKASVIELRDRVLVPLTRAGRPWRLFVRGAADTRPVSGPVGRTITYLPRAADGTHSLDHARRQVGVAIQNEDLPTLRADWLREVVRSVLGTDSAPVIDILENPPQPGHRRTAELVLLVEW